MMLRFSLVVCMMALAISFCSFADAQVTSHSRIVTKPRALNLPSQRSNTNLEAYRRGNNFYVVPLRRRVVIPAQRFPPYYQSYRPGYYSNPLYGRTIISRSPSASRRRTTGGSHYFGNPHASQYFGNPHASQSFGR